MRCGGQCSTTLSDELSAPLGYFAGDVIFASAMTASNAGFG
jgi:hypothetical protein